MTFLFSLHFNEYGSLKRLQSKGAIGLAVEHNLDFNYDGFRGQVAVDVGNFGRAGTVYEYGIGLNRGPRYIFARPFKLPLKELAMVEASIVDSS